MSKQPSGFRSKKDDVTGQRTTFPIFDSVGRPLKSSSYVDSSREQMHAMRMERYEQSQAPIFRRVPESCTHCSKRMNECSQCIAVQHPNRDVILKLRLVNLSDVHSGEKAPANLERRSQYFYNMYKDGKTVPPILVHQDPETGRYIIFDGHARFHALKRLYRETGTLPYAPAIENAAVTSRPIGSEAGHEQWKHSDVTGRWAATLPKQAEPRIPVVENLSLGDIGKGLKSIGHVATHLQFKTPKEPIKAWKYRQKREKILKVARPFRKAESAIGKAQEKVKGFRGVVKTARLRMLRRQVETGTPEQKKKARLALIDEFPEQA
jgi:hypothetical protein